MSRCLLLLALAAGQLAADEPLPPGAVARLGASPFHFRNRVSQTFLPGDGRTLYAKNDHTLQAWDVETGKTLWEWKDRGLFGSPADLSPDGTRLALFAHDMDRRGLVVRLYELATRKLLWAARLGDSPAPRGSYVRFTPDGKRLVTTAGRDAWVWDADTGAEVARRSFPGGNGSRDLSPDGKALAVGGNPAVVWAWETKDPPRPLMANDPRHPVRFAPDGKSVFTIPDGHRPRLYDIATGRRTGLFECDGRAGSIYPAPDGKTVAVAYVHGTVGGLRAGTVALWDVPTGKPGPVLSGRGDWVMGGSWSRDGRRFAAANSERAFVWDAKTGKPLGPGGPGHTREVRDMAFAPDGRVFTASIDHTLRVWDGKTGAHLQQLDMASWVGAVAVSPDGALVAGSALGDDLRVWDTKTWKVVYKLTGHGRLGGLRLVRFSADEQTLLAYGDDLYLRAWDTLTGKLKSEHRLLPPALAGADLDDDQIRFAIDELAVALGPDGNTLAKGVGREVVVYAADTGKERLRFPGDPGAVERLAFSPDGGRLAVAGPGVELDARPVRPVRPAGYVVTVWDLKAGKAVAQVKVADFNYAAHLAFTPDGKRIVTNSHDDTLQFWDAATGAAAGTLSLPGSPGAIAFDGNRRLAVGVHTSALVYDLMAVKPTKK